MAKIYSTRFLLGETASGEPLSATVPAGFVWVLASIDATTAVNTGELFATLAGLTFWSSGPITVSAGAIAPAMWRGRQVLNAGEILSVGSAGAFDVAASGYQLSAP